MILSDIQIHLCFFFKNPILGKMGFWRSYYFWLIWVRWIRKSPFKIIRIIIRKKLNFCVILQKWTLFLADWFLVLIFVILVSKLVKKSCLKKKYPWILSKIGFFLNILATFTSRCVLKYALTLVLAWDEKCRLLGLCFGFLPIPNSKIYFFIGSTDRYKNLVLL